VQVVQFHYDEGVANHIGPESCVRGRRKAHHEALTGVRADQQLRRDRKLFLGADTVCVVEGNRSERVSASARATRRGRRTWYAWKRLVREPGGLESDQSRYWAGPRRGGER
jgi:hypothetical protein